MFLFGCAIGAYFAFYFHYKEHKNDANKIIVPDTTYNKITLDSIEVNIKQKDSVITKIKYKMQYEIKKADTISNDSAVKLFKQLCTD